MKKIFIFALFSILIISLSSCSLFAKRNTTSLSAPTNLAFREERTSLSWDKVDNATSYTIKISYEEGEPVFLKSSSESAYLGSLKPGRIDVSVMAENERTKEKSAYSESIKIDFLAPVDIDESSVKSEYSDNVLTICWDSVEHANGYVLSYQVGGNPIQKVELNKNEYSVTYSEKQLNCQIILYATGSGKYKDGRKIRYVHIGEADYDNPTATYVADLNDAQDVVITYTFLLDAFIDGESVSSIIDGSSKNFTLSNEFLSELALGLHNVALVGIEEVRTYKLEIINSKTPEISIGNFVYDGNDVVGELKKYGNEIISVCGYYSPLSQTQAQIIDDKVIVYADYLNIQPEGELKLNVSYKSPKSDETKYLPFSIEVSASLAELNEFNYYFDGNNDLRVDISTHGDKVVKLTSDGVFVPSYNYTSDSNLLTIKKSFLNQKIYKTFIIETRKGGFLSFTVHYTSNSFIPSSSLYKYDKTLSSDLYVDGRINSKDIAVFGNGITPVYYSVKNEKIVLSSDFLQSLDAGTYSFAVYSGEVYSSFDVKIFESIGRIENVKLDYDTSQEQVFIEFECSCGEDEHFYTYNDNRVKCKSGDLVLNVDRTIAQSITLYCETYSDEKTYSISPSSSAIEYLKRSYEFNGREHDCYIESTLELSEVLTFLSFGGNGIIVDKDAPSGRSELEVFFSNQYLEYAKTHDNYFKEASNLVSIPYNCGFSLSSQGNAVTLSAKFKRNPNEIISSGMKKEPISDLTDYLSKGNRPQSFSDFPINSYNRETMITTIAELEHLSYGLRPIFSNFNDPAKELYEKALSICRTYISRNMTDIEKVMTFYHYLTTRVTYDTNALEIYNLRAEIAELDINNAKSLILSVITENGSLNDFLSPLLNLNSIDEIRRTLIEKMSSLSSFSAYGALIDGVAVCDGISSAMKLLCDIEGIECIEVSGLGITSSGRENHSWNKVKINGDWYIIDATWGRNSGYVNHRYFMIDENDAKSTHIENPDVYMNSAVDSPATGFFDYYVWNVEPYTHTDMRVQSESELKNLVKALMANGELQFEIKLDFAYTSVSSVIKSLNLTCTYFVFDNIVLIIL